MRGVPIDLDALGSKGYLIAGSTNVGLSGGWWGVRPANIGSLDTNLPQIWAQQQKVVADDKKRRTEVWIQLDELLADARKKLTDKHKTRF